MTQQSKFYLIEPSNENYWRAIILFGRNVASYKFALAKALYDMRKRSGDLIKLEDLAPAYAEHICEHLLKCDRQATSPQSKFLDACRAYNNNDSDHSHLIENTVKLGFQNVIDAFHNVHGSEIPKRFFLDERATNGGIRLTDEFFNLAETPQFADLNSETEARWRLVETAWSLSMPRQALQVSLDDTSSVLQVATQARRVSITSSRDALNGYQKGRCFYCFQNISTEQHASELADVDHFFPHMLHFCADGKPINGVANLVLACRECNRGREGKFDRLPEPILLERLHNRNEYLIGSHHPLRETLMVQTGTTEAKRRNFLQSVYSCSRETIISTWRPQQRGYSVF
ncbi:HNH endonuclease domain-containing protein [Desulfurispira natronophila]|uniref:HNH endonuclease n=1 Tax=Desulfurispira natronophila TaxID=682562 RepID=A0A7W7Y3Q2_9BACT|nr:HNH endonuclease domain-containing protein [Desulfurispira natronophila]MBB5021369.1 hypothetical protein [Desulfurispira natronophila]